MKQTVQPSLDKFVGFHLKCLKLRFLFSAFMPPHQNLSPFLQDCTVRALAVYGVILSRVNIHLNPWTSVDLEGASLLKRALLVMYPSDCIDFYNKAKYILNLSHWNQCALKAFSVSLIIEVSALSLPPSLPFYEKGREWITLLVRCYIYPLAHHIMGCC